MRRSRDRGPDRVPCIYSFTSEPDMQGKTLLASRFGSNLNLWSAFFYFNMRLTLIRCLVLSAIIRVETDLDWNWRIPQRLILIWLFTAPLLAFFWNLIKDIFEGEPDLQGKTLLASWFGLLTLGQLRHTESVTSSWNGFFVDPHDTTFAVHGGVVMFPMLRTGNYPPLWLCKGAGECPTPPALQTPISLVPLSYHL